MMSDNARIPFLDLVTPHFSLQEELTDVFRHALKTGVFIGGPMVEEFEKEFAQLCESRYCVGVGSGTDALRFALIAAGVHQGDIVLTVPNTFVATTEAISQSGARPDFVDVDERTYTLDPKKLLEYLEHQCTRTPSRILVSRRDGRPVKAVTAVHLYGQIADMDAILSIAHEYGLLVIEDACQAHGAEYYSRTERRWCRAGSMGDAAAFSFYPGKNLGACGEGGAVTTNNATLANICRMLRDHGQAQKYYHEIEGYNGRLDAIQAAILRIKLAYLPQWNDQRRKAAARYKECFGTKPPVVLPHQPNYSNPVFHLYVVRAHNRDCLQKHLSNAGIGTGIHYPIPLHVQKAYVHLGYKAGDFPAADKIASEIISLPMYPSLSAQDVSRVVTTVKAFTAAEQSTEIFASAC
jgi:dTDP-4-amino-4,6-dideoxygalactose transaminase